MDLPRAVEKLGEIEGQQMALMCLLFPLCEAIPGDALKSLLATYERDIAIAQAALLHSSTPETTLQAFDAGVARTLRALRRRLERTG